jgi:hypothetical protein
MFKRIHRDAYTAMGAAMLLAALITLMLVIFNPVP